ncbi:RNA-directed DNA polymerase, eukaryota, reverse transcriptase zinc-binding domain protein, partial [Tanacetum coccineum]
MSANRRHALNHEKEEIIRKIKSFDASISSKSSDFVADYQRSSWIDRLRQIEVNESLDSNQKAKVKWCAEVDENSKFFHAIANQRRIYLAIQGIKVDGHWIVDPPGIKDAFISFFEKKFKHMEVIKVVNRSPFYKSLTNDQSSFLDSPISSNEIKAAIWDCGSDKSPGPDGFTFAFYKEFWNTIKDDVVTFVHHFFATGSLPRGCNNSFITLIPKVPNPMVASDFRPISLIGAQYKIIAKVLANRLACVIDTIISHEQSAFIKNRQILDGPLMVNEFMGFSDKWIKWISGCLSSASTSILINGSPSREFSIHRGLRQGDPLSPFLFIIAMEGLHVAMEDAMAASIYSGFCINNLSLSHLFFADDALFIGDWSSNNIKCLVAILDCFHKVSGLKINYHKSKLFGVGVSPNEISALAATTGCSPLASSFNYLGLPVDCNMSRVKSWDPIVEKFSSRLSRWRASLLSFGGRATLISSVLGALGTYFFSLFPMPSLVDKKLESIRAKFFWGSTDSSHKVHWIRWKDVLASKDKGGLGIGSLYALNQALILKWRWRFLTNPHALWARLITAIYDHNKDPTSFFSHIKSKGVWSRIVGSINHLHEKNYIRLSSMKRQVNNATNKDSSVRENWQNGWNLAWVRNYFSGYNASQLVILQNMISSIILNDSEDTWTWSLGGNFFTVRSARRQIDGEFLPDQGLDASVIAEVQSASALSSAYVELLETTASPITITVCLQGLPCEKYEENEKTGSRLKLQRPYQHVQLNLRHISFDSSQYLLSFLGIQYQDSSLVDQVGVGGGGGCSEVGDGNDVIGSKSAGEVGMGEMMVGDGTGCEKKIGEGEGFGLDVSVDVEAQKCLARGLRLNYTEAVALIATQILGFVHDGDKSVAELMDIGRQVLGRRQVLPTVPHLLDSVQVEGTFPDGTKLITVHDPVSSENGNLELALHGSFLPKGDKIPGELILKNGHILLNSGREAVILKVTNEGDRPIQVGSHYHFIEVNPCLIFDRRKAYGMRLNIPAGTATRFEPGDAKSVTLVRIGGNQVIRGSNAIAVMESVNARAFDNITDTSTWFENQKIIFQFLLHNDMSNRWLSFDFSHG